VLGTAGPVAQSGRASVTPRRRRCCFYLWVLEPMGSHPKRNRPRGHLGEGSRVQIPAGPPPSLSGCTILLMPLMSHQAPNVTSARYFVYVSGELRCNFGHSGSGGTHCENSVGLLRFTLREDRIRFSEAALRAPSLFSVYVKDLPTANMSRDVA
jgi:hypothetical protein